MTIQTNAVEESVLGGSLVASPLNEGSVDRLIHVVAGGDIGGIGGGLRFVGLDDDFLRIIEGADTGSGQTVKAVSFNDRGDLFMGGKFGIPQLIRKIDNCGAVKWSFNIGALGNGVALSSDGSKLYVVGASNGSWTGSEGPTDLRNLWVLNTTTGALIDSKQVGPDNVDLVDVVLDSSGNIIVGGIPFFGTKNVFKLTPGLLLTWDWSSATITGLAVDSNDNVYAVGQANNIWEDTDGSFRDVWKLSSGSGAVLATMLIGNSSHRANDVDVDDADNVYIVAPATGEYPGATGTVTALAAAIDAVTGIITVIAPAVRSGGFNITIDSEVMSVAAGGLTTTWTVGRGPTPPPVAHAFGATVTARDELRNAFKATSSLGSLVWTFLAGNIFVFPSSLLAVSSQADGERIYIGGGAEAVTGGPDRSVWQLDKDGVQELTFDLGDTTRDIEVRANR